jgi:outer membrane protein assembly factor BamD (BamD/ComL family)
MEPETRGFHQEEFAMSVAGISAASFFNFNTQSIASRKQQFSQEFQQLGQDLQSGDLTKAQADFSALQQLGSNSTSSTQSNNPIAQDFAQLSKDLQAGDVSAAQQDFSKLQQDFQSQTPQVHHHHHHHHHPQADSTQSSSSASTGAISRAFDQLGQALQKGDLAAAQQAYSTMQQDFQQLGQSDWLRTAQLSFTSATTTSASGTSNVSLTA